MLSDSELISQVRHGTAEAFGVLVRRYERSVLGLALAELRDLHAAEDVAQAAFLLAYRRLETLQDARRFGPWLMQIARRQVLDLAGARRVPVTTASGMVIDPSADDTAPSWVEHEHLLSLVARLPEQERVLVGLRYFDGHSVAEIAELSGRPLGTVTKQLSRAVARLRDWYETEPEQ